MSLVPTAGAAPPALTLPAATVSSAVSIAPKTQAIPPFHPPKEWAKAGVPAGESLGPDAPIPRPWLQLCVAPSSPPTNIRTRLSPSLRPFALSLFVSSARPKGSRTHKTSSDWDVSCPPGKGPVWHGIRPKHTPSFVGAGIACPVHLTTLVIRRFLPAVFLQRNGCPELWPEPSRPPGPTLTTAGHEIRS